MTLFPTYQRCRGVRLPLGRWQVEFWYCPAGETIPMHVHSSIHSRLLCLWGWMRWSLLHNGRYVTRLVLGPLRRRGHDAVALAYFTVPAGMAHGATVLGRRALFVNFETVLKGHCSAAHDFQLVRP